MDSIDIAVITGGHTFEVRPFHQLFRELPGVNAYIQHMEDFASSPQATRESYAVLVFYGMPIPTPEDSTAPNARYKPFSALNHMLLTGQGILIWHHALMSYPLWPFWDQLTGMGGRDTFEYYDDQVFNIETADSSHYITRGSGSWQIEDETYVLREPGAGSQVLLSTTYAKSMRAIAWVRELQRTRVFNFQSGHDHHAWENPHFRTVLARGIAWCARHDTL